MKHIRQTLATVALLAGPVAAQPTAPTPPPAPQAPADAKAPAQLPAGIRLGHRVVTVDHSIVVIPIVEIAPDTGAYLDAIARWSPERGAWPVLINDGSDRAREDIARFVRAFQPKRIFTLAPKGRVDEADLEDRVFETLRSAWEAREGQLIETKWKEVNMVPAGVVAANAADPAWTAAIALAAGRGQPIVWFLAPLIAPGGQTESAEVHGIDNQIREGLAKYPWTFRNIGDDIDAVTLCASLGGRVVNEPGVKGPAALTDVLGRMPGGARWAWAGWIFGSESAAAYTAMCSLFLTPDSAWLFDAYGAKFPPEYACHPVVTLLERIKWPVTITEPEGATLRTWRGRCEGGIDASVIQVNTLGHYNWFKLIDVNAWSNEIPALVRPALVSFTHSFSAQYINGPNTISGRWIEEGAWGYIGSIDEPNLGAFVPPNVLFSRLLAGGALGYAPRLDDAPPWKIQIYGDPLKSFSDKRNSGIVPKSPPPGAHPLDDAMKYQLETKHLGEACASLVMLGRDDDAVRLARSALATDTVLEPERVAIARSALRPAYRVRDPGFFVQLYGLVPPEVAARDGERALLWQILRPSIEDGTVDEAAVSLLMLNTRPESVVDDAAAIRSSVARIFGDDAVKKMYLRLIDQTKDENAKQALARAAGPR